MGAVFAAYDEQLDRKVALKILRQTRSGAQIQRQRTLREARAAARIAHPNVIAVYEVGENDGNIHIAMEYVEGGTLLEWQTQERRAWRAILEMYLQAGAALLAAHDAEVVHRDFKPDTVSSTAARALLFRTER
jgi:serine/threonine protein kinase